MVAEPAGAAPPPGLAPLPPAAAVSVIMPVLNEERHLAAAVRHVLAQDYEGALEVVLALGPSTDRTDEIATAMSLADPRVRLVRNPSGRTPAALNAAVAAARHDVIVRVDGHGILPPGYVRTATQLLRETGADNVGGIMAAEGTTAFERAVAAAMTSRFGVGSARFHVGGQAGPADTVYLGVFRRETLERLGGYDESYTRAQDWELNYRIRSSGGSVWFSPRLRVTYRPRSTVPALARQYYSYGRWRRAVLRQHPGSGTLRYLAPPVAVLAMAAGAAAAVAGRRSGLLAPAGYGLVLTAGTLSAGRGLDRRARALLPVVLATMHGAWGIGFLLSPRGLRDESGPGPEYG